jgi:hypothetical protein
VGSGGAGSRKASAVERSLAVGDLARAGIAAGIAGGIVMELWFFALLMASGAPAGAFAASFASIAVALLGAGAAANPAAVPIGIVAHFCVAVGWALGYAHLARTKAQLVQRPWISGAGFGLVVYVFMRIILLGAGPYQPPPLMTGLIAHVVFYGIPVGLVTARLLRPSIGSAQV